MKEYIFFFISDSAEFPTYVDDDYEYEKPSSKRSDHLLRFARRLNGNDDDIFAKRGGDDHFLRFAKRYGYFSHFWAIFYIFSDRYIHNYKYEKPSKRSDHLLCFARCLNGNDDNIFAKRGGDDHFLRFAKRYGYFSHFLALFYNFSDRYNHYYKWRRPLPSFR